MNLHPRTEQITVQDEILLNTQKRVFKVGGLTLDASAFGDGVVKAGNAVMVDQGSGLAVPYSEATEGNVPDNDGLYFTTHDVVVKNGQNVQVGGYIEAYLNESKLTGVTQAFKNATGSRYIFG